MTSEINWGNPIPPKNADSSPMCTKKQTFLDDDLLCANSTSNLVLKELFEVVYLSTHYINTLFNFIMLLLKDRARNIFKRKIYIRILKSCKMKLADFNLLKL